MPYIAAIAGALGIGAIIAWFNRPTTPTPAPESFRPGNGGPSFSLLLKELRIPGAHLTNHRPAHKKHTQA